MRRLLKLLALGLAVAIAITLFFGVPTAYGFFRVHDYGQAAGLSLVIALLTFVAVLVIPKLWRISSAKDKFTPTELVRGILITVFLEALRVLAQVGLDRVPAPVLFVAAFIMVATLIAGVLVQRQSSVN